MVEIAGTLDKALRRYDIDQAIKGSTNIRETINKVKARDTQRRELTSQLMTELILPDEQLFNITKYLYEKLSLKYPNLAAIGLAGSGVHGGMQLRRYAGNLEEADLDIFSVVKKPLNPPFDLVVQNEEKDQAFLMNREAAQLVKQLVTDNDPLVKGLPKDFELCQGINLVDEYVEDISDKSEDEIIEMLRARDHERITSLFFPIYPLEIGQQSRVKLLKALHTIAHTDKGLWMTLMIVLEDRWQVMNSIQTKHFPDEVFSHTVLSPDTTTLKNKPSIMTRHKLAMLNQLRRKKFVQLIRSTGV